MPTMTLETTGITPSQLVDGYTLNVTGCTSNVTTDCVITSNATTETIINPVRSARMTTKGKKFITYGRVEVLAKMPAGDWLWPAIWYAADDTTH
jgi:beta-glucanase (GH16 family)